jgi:hypothetical protein
MTINRTTMSAILLSAITMGHGRPTLAQTCNTETRCAILDGVSYCS